MKISKQARRKAKALFRAVQPEGVFDEGKLRHALELIAAEKPRGYLGMLSHLQHLVKLDVDRRTARVESPAPLGADAEANLKNTLTRRYGPGLYISFHVNPSLIGGLRIRVGSDVFDGSVSGRLKQLEDSLAQ
jgi:F-type H+-transporting ATPase subunit delta